MLPEDERILKDLFLDYTPQLIMKRLIVIASKAADEASDNGLKKQAKELSHLAQALEDITKGRPFLV